MMSSKEWYKLHNFSDNMNYCRKVLSKFDIHKYHFVNDGYGGVALLIELGLNSYRVEIDIDNCKMIIKKKQTRRMGQKHPKDYLKVVMAFNKDAIYNSIKWISLDNRL